MGAKRKSKKKRALNGTATGKNSVTEKVKQSAIATGKDLLIGVIGGGIAGAVIGKSSLLIGIGISGYGHYANKPSLTVLGIGMMAGSGISAGANTTQGVDGFSAEEVKARIMSFKDSLSSRLFLDKIIKKKDAPDKTESATNGMGAIQYFTYPNQNKELDFSALDHLENQINQSGADYQKNIKGTDVQGNSDESLDLSSTSY